MTDQLKNQQEKLIINERHEAWSNLARKLAHEIKNPLTPIQLSIDRLREKYSKKIEGESENFEKYLETINRQIKDIENLVNEFSNFARMPRPILKKVCISDVIKDSINFIKLTSKNEINFISNQNDLNSGGDLPDNTSVNITNYIFSNSYSGSGELDYGDDNDKDKRRRPQRQRRKTIEYSLNLALCVLSSFPTLR